MAEQLHNLTAQDAEVAELLTRLGVKYRAVDQRNGTHKITLWGGGNRFTATVTSSTLVLSPSGLLRQFPLADPGTVQQYAQRNNLLPGSEAAVPRHASAKRLWLEVQSFFDPPELGQLRSILGQ